MASYEYECKTCELTQVLIRSMLDETVIPSCAKCGVPMVRRFAAPGISFRGTGWGHQ
jgi:putative FmdB family regulatory protein